MGTRTQRLRDTWGRCRLHCQKQSPPNCKLGQVTVIPTLGNRMGNTPTTSIITALLAISGVMAKLNASSIKRQRAEMDTKALATAMINIVNAMATVPDHVKPRVIRPYHIFATRTAIGNFLNLRSTLIDNSYDLTTVHTILELVVKAYTYFGMTVLVHRAPEAMKLAEGIVTAITNSMNYTTILSRNTADTMAFDLGSKLHIASPANPPTFYQTPLVSILTDKELTRLKRYLARKYALCAA
ncbi:hypothetical protein QBC38DRAFT_446944 [Podospora fimiseda]|uniref:Uncharacterized protein n=1 Tax=Podospora fimiseda TaxID=252190 RepID=A0AAN7BI42_9PEZI|nr:hypothetical protein QBC38DRAFT_446944 [Podospora fimiseda]